MIRKLSLIISILSALLIQACAPYETSSIDLGEQLPLHSNIQVTLSNQEKINLNGYKTQQGNKSLYIFILPEGFTEVLIQSLYVQVSGYADLNISFKDLQKNTYQLESRRVSLQKNNHQTSSSMVVGTKMLVELLSRFIIPNAHARTCVSPERIISYKNPGTLIEINLTPL